MADATNGGKPSYLSSTTSQIFLVTAVGYVLVALALAILGILKNHPQYATAAHNSLESLLTFVGLLYGVRKGGEMVKNGLSSTAGGGNGKGG